ncbi:MAG: VOC family protein [Saprospiraceae bacterium]|nr:VOC family protein [Saprospiraceae bacterium]
MLTKIYRTRYVLAVQNLALSVQYYQEKLGFTTDWTVGGWHQLSRDVCTVMLGECTDDRSAFELRNHSYFAYIDVEGIDALFEELQARGVEMMSMPTSQPWGQREFGIRTIDGHRVMFGEPL